MENDDFRVISSSGSDAPIDRPDLYFSRTSGVDQEDYDAVIEAAEKFLAEVQSQLTLQDHGNFYLHDGPYGSADWYPSGTAVLPSGQVGTERLMIRLQEEPYQQAAPHRDFFVLDQDLTNESGTNFVYGGNNGIHSILSTHRFKQLAPDVRKLVLQFLTAHELGHGFGLVGRSHNMREILGKHCAGQKGPCLMEQVDVAGSRTAVEQAELVIPQERWLCEDCQHEIAWHRANAETTF